MGLFDRGPVIKLHVGGMHCDHCVARVRAALVRTKGVKKVDVNLKKETASVYLQAEGSATAGDLISAVAMAGFDASVKMKNPDSF